MKNSADKILPIISKIYRRSDYKIHQSPNGSANHSIITNCLAVSNFTETTQTD